MRVFGFLIVFVCSVECANILFVVNSITNSVVLHAGRLADLLVENGHNVTFLLPVAEHKHCPNGSKLAHIVRMQWPAEYFKRAFEQYQSAMGTPGSGWVPRKEIIVEAELQFCDDLLQRRDEFAFLSKTQFDVAISNDYHFCHTGIAHMLGVRARTWLVTGPLHEYMMFANGVPAPPSFIPVIEDMLLGTEMSFWERVQNLQHYLGTYYLYRRVCYQMTQVFRKHIGSSFPDVCGLAGEAALVFVNDNEFLNYPRPVLHKMVYVGGAGQQAPKPLSSEVTHWMTKGTKGVVLVSFGTAAQTSLLGREKLVAMARAFETLTDFHFIWKVPLNDTDIHNLTSNIRNVQLVHWVPQRDLLAHPRLKAFVNHGGYNGILEAATEGVPMVTVPLFFDQFRNAKMVEHRGIGKVVVASALTTNSFYTAVKSVLLEPKFSKAAQRMKRLIAAQPSKPDSTFLDWVNFVAEHGALPELTSHGSRLSWFMALNLDIFATFAFLLIAIGFVIVKIINFVRKQFFPLSKLKQK